MIEWVVLVFLVLAAILDFKFRQVPAVALTCLAFLTLFLNPENLVFGILAVGIFMIYNEVGIPLGMADFKIIFVLGLMISTAQNFFIFGLVLALGMTIYSYLMVKFTNFKDGDYPLIPGGLI